MKKKEDKYYPKEMVISIKDWRQALRTPPSYRVGNSTLRVQTKFVSLIAMGGLFFLLIIYIFPVSEKSTDLKFLTTQSTNLCTKNRPYNSTYPLTSPLIFNGMMSYRIGIIADLDTNSKSKSEPHMWYSYLRKGYLSYSKSNQKVIVNWDKQPDIQLKSTFSSKDRGMELSELLVFDGRLLAFDDRSGIIYEILKDTVIPWIILTDGNGYSSKGFKSEWATVKDNTLYVGSMGKEWTTDSGAFVNNNPQYIKVVSAAGEIKHVNWINQYKAIRSVLGINWPGYMIHESGAWSEDHNRWFFLPRRCSVERYNETLDEIRGCNVLITADMNFENVKVNKVGEQKPTHGFSSFKFIPGTYNQAIVALKTEEYNGSTATYITAFTVDGKELMPETKISDQKFEGIEFI